MGVLVAAAYIVRARRWDRKIDELAKGRAVLKD